MCARAVEANLSGLNSSCAELGASATVHPDLLAPLGQSCEVRLLAVEAFIRRVSPRIRVEVRFLNLESHGKVDGLAPECLGKEKGDGAGMLKEEETAVEGFRYSIVLSRIVCSGATLTVSYKNFF